jgi:hypothetical protein
MKKLALITAALLASTALAAAQGVNTQAPAGNKTEQAAPAPSAQQNAPAEKTAPQAQNGAKETTGQAPKAGADAKSSAQMNSETPKANADTKAGASGKAGADTRMKAQDDKAGAGKNGNRNAQRNMTDKDKNKASAQGKAGERDNKAAAQGKANERNGKANARNERNGKGKDATTGQGAAGSRGAANLSTEQRTKIRTVIREKVKVKPVEHVNFSVHVGTVVPRTIHYHPLPAEVVSIYPAWSGYYFVLVGTQIVVIEPSSFEIVAVLA